MLDLSQLTFDELSQALAKAGGIAQLARVLGVARCTVQKWVDGAHTPALLASLRVREYLAGTLAVEKRGKDDPAYWAKRMSGGK